MLIRNPEVQNYLHQHQLPMSHAFRQLGLLTPSPEFHFSPTTAEYQIPNMLGDATGRALQGRQLLRPVGSYLSSFHENPGRAALLSALGLGGAGALYGAFTGRDPVVSGLVGAGLGGLGGYGLGKLIQNNVQRRDYPYQLLKASYYVLNGQDPMSYIQERLLQDDTMTSDRRANLMMAVQNMPQQRLTQLADVLRSTFGAAVGYIVGRFVLNLGGTGTGIAAGLGGLLGMSMGGEGGDTFRNAIGLPVRPRQDFFWKPSTRMKNDLGIAIGLTEHGYNPGTFGYIKGSNAVWDKEGGPAGRLLIKAAHDVLVATGRGRGAPAWHLHFLSKLSSWDEHAKEVVAHIANVLEVLDPMRKQAMMVAHPFGVPALVETAGMLGRAGVLGAAGLGGGLGSLYWLLSRHANQDTADIEAMKNQTDYYHQLSRELDDSMRRKYRYERHQQPGEQSPNGTESSSFAA